MPVHWRAEFQILNPPKRRSCSARMISQEFPDWVPKDRIAFNSVEWNPVLGAPVLEHVRLTATGLDRASRSCIILRHSWLANAWGRGQLGGVSGDECAGTG